MICSITDRYPNGDGDSRAAKYEDRRRTGIDNPQTNDFLLIYIQREKDPQPPSRGSQKLKHRGISTRTRLICTPIEEDEGPDPNPVEPPQSSVPSSDQMDNADEDMVRLMETAIKRLLFQKNGGNTKTGKIGGIFGAQDEKNRMKAGVSSAEHRVSLVSIKSKFKNITRFTLKTDSRARIIQARV